MKPSTKQLLNTAKHFCQTLADITGTPTSLWKTSSSGFIYQIEGWPIEGTLVCTTQPTQEEECSN